MPGDGVPAQLVAAGVTDSLMRRPRPLERARCGARRCAGRRTATIDARASRPRASTRHALDRDQVAEPLLERALDEQLRRRGELVGCGANTSCSRPLPKSGRLTRSPGAVNSTCSIRSRMWSSSSVVAVRPRPSKWIRVVDRSSQPPQVAVTRVWATDGHQRRARGRARRDPGHEHDRLADRP